MKKTIAVLITASLLVLFACHRKAVPVVADRVEEPPPPQPPAMEKGTMYAVNDISAGKTVYEAKCGRCHGLKTTADYTQEKWEGILKSMIPKARLNEQEATQVTAYVMMNAKK